MISKEQVTWEAFEDEEYSDTKLYGWSSEDNGIEMVLKTFTANGIDRLIIFNFSTIGLENGTSFFVHDTPDTDEWLQEAEFKALDYLNKYWEVVCVPTVKLFNTGI